MNYVPGTASLIDDIDKKHLVLLRDGRTLIGYLRSIDQFANLVFHQTVERIHVGKKFGDIPRGIFIVRGENVVLLGEIVSSSKIFYENIQSIKNVWKNLVSSSDQA
uniref:U6 snRNA-associated Sm-like protein LSm1 n=1 Tax=Periophthalmus magnuspinnatus TaxID=409849 RepID=A0A3B4BJ80_9GOBI